MLNVFGQWDAHVTAVVGVLLLVSVLLLLLILLILNVLFCRKSNPRFCSSDGPSKRSRVNDAFDIMDETDPNRIEERLNARQRALYCVDTRADVTAKKFDRSMGSALAVEQLLRGSYVFDTNILERPRGDVLVIAAKRDYL